jgi:hypothetical protein
MALIGKLTLITIVSTLFLYLDQTNNRNLYPQIYDNSLSIIGTCLAVYIASFASILANLQALAVKTNTHFSKTFNELKQGFMGIFSTAGAHLIALIFATPAQGYKNQNLDVLSHFYSSFANICLVTTFILFWAVIFEIGLALFKTYTIKP